MSPPCCAHLCNLGKNHCCGLADCEEEENSQKKNEQKCRIITPVNSVLPHGSDGGIHVRTVLQTFQEHSNTLTGAFWISGFGLSLRVESHLTPLPPFAALPMCSGAVTDTSCSVRKKAQKAWLLQAPHYPNPGEPPAPQ